MLPSTLVLNDKQVHDANVFMRECLARMPVGEEDIDVCGTSQFHFIVRTSGIGDTVTIVHGPSGDELDLDDGLEP